MQLLSNMMIEVGGLEREVGVPDGQLRTSLTGNISLLRTHPLFRQFHLIGPTEMVGMLM